MQPCQICGNTRDNKLHMAREMMFGLREQFEYLECARCGCLQIGTIPADLSRYYPDDYYSLQSVRRPKRKNPVLSFVLRQRARHQLGARNFTGWLIAKAGRPREYFDWLRRAGVGLGSQILDVGCGAGGFLVKLQKHGFTRLTGLDPFISEEIDYGGGLRILKRTLPEMDGQFDLILSNHSFEHMPDPLAALREIRRLLKANGCALLRMPYADCYAWRKYGTSWVQLDPPRHLFLHTDRSMNILAREAGLQVREITFDSTEFQFLGSEQYLRDIPLRDPRSFSENPKNSPFTRSEIAGFSRKALELNLKGEGDQACFYMSRR